MKGFVGIGRADHVETAITEATAGLKKADFLILIAPFSKIEAAAALLGEKYPGTPMIGTSGEGIAKEMRLTQAIIVIGFAGVEVCTGVIEDPCIHFLRICRRSNRGIPIRSVWNL